MGALRNCWEKTHAGERRDHCGEHGDNVLPAEKLGEKESGPFQARLSNFSHYALTGVIARAFVLVTFYYCMWYRQLY
jgi:hypothetical protein